jgi:hypothetical protein
MNCGLLAGIDLLTGKVHALVRERHRSREFIEFLKLLDAAYPASTAIKLILDNHSAHISRETRAWLDTRPPGRFDFTFTPKPCSLALSQAKDTNQALASGVIVGSLPGRGRSSSAASAPVRSATATEPSVLQSPLRSSPTRPLAAILP